LRRTIEPYIPAVIPPLSRSKGIKAMLSSIVRYFHDWKRYGTAMQELSQLSDRELSDIGITRADIPRVAWEQSRQ
jgi:uncharacterized protein YjiS (DUF1127 family)